MIKIAVLGVGAAILAAWLKSIKSEYAIWILLAAGVVLGISVVGKLQLLVEELLFFQTYVSSYGSYVKLLVKILGITYLAEISADLCKDAGAGALASQIELFGKITILVLSLPILLALLRTIQEFMT